MAETTNTLSDAEIQGRQLAQQLCEASMENATNTGVLKIRNAKGMTTTVPVKFETIVTKTNWLNIYEISNSTYKSGKFFKLMVTHIGVSNEYLASFPMVNADVSWGTLNCYTQIVTIPIQSDAKTMVPFANSDFWLCDLGLEFFHWPAQKVLKKEVKRSRGCTVLESTNPDPATNGYSRVVSWIDGESGGIVQAQAYDANNKLLKEFYPKDFKKVKGQWQVERLDIDNVQTGSHTRLEFDLKAP